MSAAHRRDPAYRLGRNVAHLIALRYEGNVNRAARESGLAYDVLYRLAGGHVVRKVSADHLVAIAQHFNVTTDALLTTDMAGGRPPAGVGA